MSKQPEAGACALCGRITRRGTTEHHVIPRSCHGNRWFRKRFTREELRETLLAHPQLARFIAWARKQR